jgi:hypothetical protein
MLSLPRSRSRKQRLRRKKQNLRIRAKNGLIKIVALIKRVGLSTQDIVKAMRGTRGHKKAITSTLAGRKAPQKYRNPFDKNPTCTGRERMPAWAAVLS